MLSNELEQFYGTEHYYSLPNKDIVLTDGLAYFVKKTKSRDLIEHIIDVIQDVNKQGEPFVTVQLESGSLGVTVSYTDGNYKKVAPIEVHGVSGIDEGEYTFFCYDNVLMLNSEY